jgi:hypothetical protein
VILSYWRNQDQIVKDCTVSDSVEALHKQLLANIEQLRRLHALEPPAPAVAPGSEDAHQDIWPESKSPLDYRICGVVWLSSITKGQVSRLVADIRRQIWRCTLATYFACVRLLRAEGVTGEIIKRAAARVPPWTRALWEQAEQMHMIRYAHGLTALGELGRSHMRVHHRNSNNGTCEHDEFTNDHGLLAFYVNFMAFHIDKFSRVEEEAELPLPLPPPPEPDMLEPCGAETAPME